jgi:hypothetical protein
MSLKSFTVNIFKTIESMNNWPRWLKTWLLVGYSPVFYLWLYRAWLLYCVSVTNSSLFSAALDLALATHISLVILRCFCNVQPGSVSMLSTSTLQCVWRAETYTLYPLHTLVYISCHFTHKNGLLVRFIPVVLKMSFFRQIQKQTYTIYRIWGFHSGGYEEYHLLGCDAV